jgi:hypothetical protein
MVTQFLQIEAKAAVGFHGIKDGKGFSTITGMKAKDDEVLSLEEILAEGRSSSPCSSDPLGNDRASTNGPATNSHVDSTTKITAQTRQQQTFARRLTKLQVCFVAPAGLVMLRVTSYVRSSSNDPYSLKCDANG